jgi:hypothetical protein
MEKEIMLKVGEDGKLEIYEETYATIEIKSEKEFTELSNSLNKVKDAETPISVANWKKDDGICLWWSLFTEGPPYVGTPLDDNFPKTVTHFTKIIKPNKTEKHVYCTNCVHMDNLMKYITDELSEMPKICESCYPYDLEDSFLFKLRKNYKEKRKE